MVLKGLIAKIHLRTQPIVIRGEKQRAFEYTTTTTTTTDKNNDKRKRLHVSQRTERRRAEGGTSKDKSKIHLTDLATS
ncbi:hypothetical protein E2C01_097105 [Portunus trituberculatus]|uniref:Uncharacterized protein n=1 Tax=Portunus trituberculatus TaxID=210409 RepID=A0A5B7JXF6_PORTR|nr:hypothetical protein [Portunus trituberculatus]